MTIISKWQHETKGRIETLDEFYEKFECEQDCKMADPSRHFLFAS